MPKIQSSSVKFLMIAILILSTSLVSLQHNAWSSILTQTRTETNVYICASPKAYAYHSSKRCRGLIRCSYEIKEVGLSVATGKMKRSACKICY